MKLYLKQLELGPLQNFVYLIGSLETREAAVVDPGWDLRRILDTAKQDEMRITTVLVTHTHFDHINAVEGIVQATDARVLVHKKESGAVPVARTSVQEMEGGQEFTLGPLKISLLHTPGHTPGSVCFSVADRLIAGDTLFIGGCGRCDLPGGDPEAMHKSLGRLAKLDDRIALYPGHNYAPRPTSSIGEEKGYNPFLKAADLDQFLGLIGAGKKQ